jgi:protein SCO1/2
VNATNAKKKVMLMVYLTIALGALAMYDRYFVEDKSRYKGLVMMNDSSDELPDHGQITGEYVFTDQDDEDFATSQMAGHVWLVSFFFTSCDGPCPLLNAQIAGILSKNNDVHALSITTDPETDTIEVLEKYAQSFKARREQWSFVRTDQDSMIKFGQTVLKLPVGEEPDAHSPRIVLIDKAGHIRGWYDSQEPNVVATITKDLKSIL